MEVNHSCEPVSFMAIASPFCKLPYNYSCPGFASAVAALKGFGVTA